MKMAEPSPSMVQVLVDLNAYFLWRAGTKITIPERDVDAREVPFGIFEHFSQHFLYSHNCFQFFKLAKGKTFGYAVLNLSNEVLFTFRIRTTREFIYTKTVAQMFYEGGVE